MVRTMYLKWLLPLRVLEAVAQSSLCSTTNTADSGSSSNIFQSQSACAERCKGKFAYAVVQYDQCWCSNTTPSSTTDSGSCNKPCPGYPIEMCGGDSQYSYILVDRSKVKAGSSTPSSQQQRPTSPSSKSDDSPDSAQQLPAQIITVTQTNEQEATTIIETVQASVSVVNVSNEDKPATFRTVTVTSTAVVSTVKGPVSVLTVSGTVAASALTGIVAVSIVTGKAAVSAGTALNINTATVIPQANGDGGSGIKKGAVAGIAVGGSAASAFVGLMSFIFWRRRKYRTAKDGVGEAEGGVRYFGAFGATTSKRDNTCASEDSRMGAFGQNKNLVRNSIGSLENELPESNQVLRVVNPDIEEKQ